ncbi:nuclease-related domain-containing protein [Fundicoccus culcitae]|uniref:NERD domain-containing protein n=1 Tax=Fundicoccus culcitae TaxID=2969821 RepID=A0ABY5P2M7_9LACT|nr:nuclease-related domain-containing protein [Fundicoccus culcitae]UUX32735.1 NERD domain-containing protein [Fundicoccus culcitae]
MNKTKQHKILEHMAARGMIKDQTLEQKLNRLKSGYEGEIAFVKWFNQYNHSYWKLEVDYWFDKDGRKQIDDILMATHRWIVVDVKNYFGKFNYLKGDCLLNGFTMGTDIFDELETKTKKASQIAAEVSRNIQVDSAMIFIGEHCQVDLDCVPKAQVVMRNELFQFIDGLEFAEPMADWLQKKVATKLDFYRTDERPPDIALEPKQFEELKKGIRCGKCSGYNMTANKLWITCMDCGKKESYKETICRHAIELRYLFYYYPEMGTTKNIYELMGGKISKRSIRRYLSIEFTPSNGGNGCYYAVKLKQ